SSGKFVAPARSSSWRSCGRRARRPCRGFLERTSRTARTPRGIRRNRTCRIDRRGRRSWARSPAGAGRDWACPLSAIREVDCGAWHLDFSSARQAVKPLALPRVGTWASTQIVLSLGADLEYGNVPSGTRGLVQWTRSRSLEFNLTSNVPRITLRG